MDLDEALLTTRAIRRYTGDPVTDEEILYDYAWTPALALKAHASPRIRLYRTSGLAVGSTAASVASSITTTAPARRASRTAGRASSRSIATTDSSLARSAPTRAIPVSPSPHTIVCRCRSRAPRLSPLHP